MRRLGVGLIGFLDFLLTGLAVLLGLAGWRLVTGPIQADFLTPHLERALSGDGLQVDIGRSHVRWDGLGRPIRLVAHETTVARAGWPAARMPAIALSLDPMALLDGRIAPTALTVEGPALHVVRTADGALQWALDRPEDGAGLPDAASDGETAPPLDPADPETWPAALRRLERLQIAGAAVVFEDRRDDRLWHGHDIFLALEYGAAGLEARFAGMLGRGEESGRLAAAAIHHASSGETDIAFRLSGLPAGLLADADRALAPLSALRARLDGTARLRLGPDWRPQTATLDLRGETGRLDLAGLYDRPLTMAGLALAAEADFPANRLRLDRAEIDLGGPRILAVGDMRAEEGAFRSSLTATLFNLPGDLLPRYWPPGLNPEAHAWVAEHIAGGRVDHATLEIAATSPLGRPADFAPQTLRARFGYSGLTVRYLDGLPPVTGISGSGSYDGEAVRFAVERGGVGELALEEAAISITDFEFPGREIIDIDLALAGPLGAALQLVDAPRLGYAGAVGIDPGTASGDMAARLRFVFPLSADLDLDEVAIGVAANLREAALGGVAGGVAVTGLDGELTLTGDGLEISGEGRFDDIAAELLWRERFRPGDGPLTRITLSGRTEAAALARFGLGDGPVSGPIGFEADYRDPDRAAQSVAVALDLTEAMIDLPELAYRKPPGEPAEAALDLRLTERRLDGPVGFALTGQAMDIRGAAALADDTGTMQFVRFDRFRLGETAFSGTLTATAAGGYVLDIDGDRFDARPWLTAEALTDAGLAPGDGADEPASAPWQVEARFREVLVGEQASLHDAAFDFAQTQGGAESGVLTARTGGGGDLRLEYSSDGGDAAAASVRTDDADALLRAFGLASRVRGGALFFQGTLEGEVARGRLRIEDFRAVEAPLLARLLGAMSLGGLADLLSGEGLSFDRLSAHLMLADDRLTIEDGRAAGGALGLSLQGTVALETGGLDLAGTVVPAYGVNSVIGAIPLVGDLLTGGDGGGVIAFTYRAGGTLDDPQVQVNPLSALTPGLLRRIFFQREGLEIEPVRGMEERSELQRGNADR